MKQARTYIRKSMPRECFECIALLHQVGVEQRRMIIIAQNNLKLSPQKIIEAATSEHLLQSSYESELVLSGNQTPTNAMVNAFFHQYGRLVDFDMTIKNEAGKATLSQNPTGKDEV